MGQPFFEFINDDRGVYVCKTCGTCLTGSKHLYSTTFTGQYGQAYLFNTVVNVTKSAPMQREMSTGNHMIRDVACKGCKKTIGWFYEFAYESEQVYKEGKYVLELTLISLRKGIVDQKGGNSQCYL
uniref:Protein yippee-like n=1 Tax=Panagrellus redivivus TaxID=6233 RepID=A0A7E4ZVA4_PANRE